MSVPGLRSVYPRLRTTSSHCQYSRAVRSMSSTLSEGFISILMLDLVLLFRTVNLISVSILRHGRGTCSTYRY
ncbi:MAG: hypothetical protein Q4Q58_04230 [Thermoplasmata archaeon]|nr:hypothetical protein [Thermoplasmata archaeon]